MSHGPTQLSAADRDEIRELGHRYTFALDDGDFAAVGALMVDAALVPDMPGVPGVPIEGRVAIEEFYREQVVVYSRGRPMTRHLVTNQVIEGSPEEGASSRAYFTVLQRPPGRDYRLVVGGQYLDAFRKVDGVWRFTQKRIRVDHLNEIQYHFKISQETAS